MKSWGNDFHLVNIILLVKTGIKAQAFGLVVKSPTWDTHIPHQSIWFMLWLHSFRSTLLLMYPGQQQMVAQAVGFLSPISNTRISSLTLWLLSARHEPGWGGDDAHLAIRKRWWHDEDCKSGGREVSPLRKGEPFWDFHCSFCFLRVLHFPMEVAIV